MKRGFISAGCWTVDRIKLIDRWPAQEELANIVDNDYQGGGSAHNVGINLRKLDPTMPVATVGMLGNDSDGDYLLEQANAYDIDTQNLRRAESTATSYSDVITVRDTGKRTFFHHTGANDLLHARHFDFSDSTAKILHLGLLGVHAQMDAFTSDGNNGWSKVLQRAQKHSILTSIEMVSIDPEQNRKLVMPCLPHIDYLIVNDHEIGGIADIATIQNGQTNIKHCTAAAKQVLDYGNMKSVTVHFPSGAICVTRDGHVSTVVACSVPQSYIKSLVGAGDAFAAGFLYAMHESWSVEKALSLGHTVAAVSLGSTTTVGATVTIKECLKIVDELDLEFNT